MAYIGSKMSERAKEAYERGEMPITKRTKDEILVVITSIRDDLDFSKLKANELKSLFLRWSGRHHTSSFYNVTDFYSIDYDCLETIKQENIDTIIKNREPRKKVEKKAKEPNLYVTALIEYDNWEGTRKHPKKVTYREIVTFRSEDKKVYCAKIISNKLLSNVVIIKKIEQKTKYANKERLEKYL